jgi:hypothetical protein
MFLAWLYLFSLSFLFHEVTIHKNAESYREYIAVLRREPGEVIYNNDTVTEGRRGCAFGRAVRADGMKEYQITGNETKRRVISYR